MAEALTGTLSQVLLPVAVLLFPDGRLPSRRWRWVLAALSQVGYVLFWLAVVGRQVSAWRRAGGERRQQLKWLMSGAAVAAVALIGFAVVDGLPNAASSATVQGADDVFGLLVAALPVAIGVGILKYRLYEIDRIISRTLAYALVTGLLVGVYAGFVLLASEVLGLSSPVSVAAATLHVSIWIPGRAP